MIGYIKGKVLSASDGSALIENNGLGYEVTCSAAAYARLLQDGEGAVFTYLSVSDAGIFLYGFDCPEEKEMFLKLTAVSGIGSKTAITILSNVRLPDLIKCIVNEDTKTLSSVKGCGKKTAERIVLELKEKVVCDGTSETVSVDGGVETDEDAVSALTGLGFSKAESVAAVRAAMNAGKTALNEIIASALKNIR